MVNMGLVYVVTAFETVERGEGIDTLLGVVPFLGVLAARTEGPR